MLANLLQTKLYIPTKRETLVPRPHLVHKLNDGLRCKLILISAPAGYGKTTVVTEWLEQIQEETAICWLSLSEDDSETRQFFSYLAAAIRPLPDAQSSLRQSIQSPQPLPAKNLMAAFINDVTPVAPPFIFILDDYHALESADIDQSIAFLIEHMPPQMTLILTSRTDPGFPISRLRARGELVELRANGLRFNQTEAAQFLQQSMNLTLSPDQIAALEKRTEGWIAGLQMAALSMQNRADVARFIDSFTGSHRFIMDYLLEEVLNQQSAEVKAFLMETAVLDNLCAELCDAVRQTSPPSQQILDQLETHNLFLIPLDNERRWYRYHHLFADLLQQRLQQQGTNIADLHNRASRWYEANGLEKKAIYHAFAAYDFKQAAKLLEIIWPQMDSNFQATIWLEWAKLLPAQATNNRPVLNVSYAWALLSVGDLETAESRLKDAEKWLSAPDERSQKMIIINKEQYRTLAGSIASARSYHAQAVGDSAKTMAYARQALEMLPADDYISRGPAASLLGLMAWAEGDLDTAFNALEEAMNGFETAGQIGFAISGTYGLADIRIAQGRLNDAIRIYNRSLQLAADHEETNIRGITDLYWGLGLLYRELGDREKEEQYLSKSESLGEPLALPNWPYRKNCTLAHIHTVQGDFEAALELLDEAGRRFFRGPVPEFRSVATLRAQVWIKQGNLADAWAWAQKQNISTNDDLTYLQEFEHLTFVRLLIADYLVKQTEDTILAALAFLARLLKEAEVRQRMASVLQILMLQAVAQMTQGDIASAHDSLKQALKLAEPAGFVQLFVVEGEPIRKLLVEIAGQTALSNYVGILLAHFPPAGLASAGELSAVTRIQPLVDPLSERELEILLHIAAGLKNKEIATKLFVSINTIHYHTKNIYSKLGVNSRIKAVARANELNLLG